MERQFAYEDFDLLIEPGSPGNYRARVLRSPTGESAPVQFTLPFSAVELENFVLKVGLPRRRTRGPGRPESASLKDFGGKLFRAVFQDELRETLLRSLSHTRVQQVGLRVRLRLADTPELAQLPWEFLYDPRRNRFLAQSRHSPLVRYLDLPDPPHPLSVEGPLRLLVMISSPSGYPALDVEQEWNAVTSAVAQPLAEGQIMVERLRANMSTLRSRLRRQEFHIFHFVGHGSYRPDWGDGVLVMEDRDGQAHEVTGEELGSLLNEYDATRLAVLNACEGARTGATDPFAGMAQSLIQQGLPAVIAMQFEITDSAAIIFARELYGAIADGYPLEAALAEARGAIRDEGHTTEWGTPVLYSRAPDGRLFDLVKPTPIVEVVRQSKETAERRTKKEVERPTKKEAERQAEERTLLGNRTTAGVSGSATPPLGPPPASVVPSRIVRILTGPTSRVGCVAFSPDGTMLATADAETVRLWDPATGKCLRTVTAHSEWVGNVAFSPDGRLLATVGADKGPPDAQAVLLWDPATGERLRTLTGHTQQSWAVAFSPDGRLLATGSHDNTARLWDPTSGECLRTLTGHTKSAYNQGVNGVAFSPDGSLLATAGEDQTARLWNPATGDSLRTLTGHGRPDRYGRVHRVAFSPDGSLLATSSDDETARLWNPATGDCLRILGHDNWVWGLAFSPDGQLLATTSEKLVCLWDPATGERLGTLIDNIGDGLTDRVLDAAFSPNGRLLATVGGEKTARLWE